MATNSRNEQTPPLWHSPGTKMTEEQYHELERLSPDRKYEYIDGIAYMMSGEVSRMIGSLIMHVSL
jgi:hypothetical protein